MPYEEFYRLIGKAGLSIKEFAELLGMSLILLRIIIKLDLYLLIWL
jgi:hypothetical protein